MSGDITSLIGSDERGGGRYARFPARLLIGYGGGTRPRTYRTPARYDALVVATITGAAFTVRELADRLGYSRSGLGHAIDRLVSWGAARIVAIRGRLGRTRLLFSRDVRRGGPRILTEPAPVTVRAPGPEPGAPGSSEVSEVSEVIIGPSEAGPTFAELMARYGYRP
jgi:hypothetical protein